MFYRLAKPLAVSELEEMITEVPPDRNWVETVVERVVIDAVKMVLPPTSRELQR